MYPIMLCIINFLLALLENLKTRCSPSLHPPPCEYNVGNVLMMNGVKLSVTAKTYHVVRCTGKHIVLSVNNELMKPHIVMTRDDAEKELFLLCK